MLLHVGDNIYFRRLIRKYFLKPVQGDANIQLLVRNENITDSWELVEIEIW